MGALAVALIPALACGAEAAKDSCFECHTVMEGTSLVFTNDVHYQNALSCADCHGGDRNETNQNLSMGAERGFKVRVTREGTPEYCGRCHSDTNFMAKYNPQARVDQLALYKTSVHGKQLAAGNKKAAECVDCHGVHNIRAGASPLSPTQPQNVTASCAKCHTATADMFRKSPHARGFSTARRPGCVACHSAHATEPATDAMLTGANGCARCHRAGSNQAKVAADIAKVLADLEAAGPGSSAALARARQAVHTLNAAAVKQAAEAALHDDGGVIHESVPARDIATLGTALSMFEIDCGRFPGGREGLGALINRPAALPEGAKWHRYLEVDKIPLDPWGRPYIYEIPGKHHPSSYDLYSLGPNGTGGDEAIGNWGPQP